MAGRIAYYGNIVKDGLVLCLDAAKKDSYPGSGTVWRDISGFGNNGTLINGPTFSSGNYGSISFDGVNDYVRLPTPTFIVPTISYSLWINKTGAKNSAAILSLQGILIEVNNSFLNYWSNVLVGQTSVSFSPVLNRWYNVCISQDNGTVNIYIDSTLVRTATMSLPNTTYGNNAVGAWGDGSRVWLGLIAQVLVYTKALSSQEILQNYNATKTRYGL